MHRHLHQPGIKTNDNEECVYNPLHFVAVHFLGNEYAFFNLRNFLNFESFSIPRESAKCHGSTAQLIPRSSYFRLQLWKQTSHIKEKEKPLSCSGVTTSSGRNSLHYSVNFIS